jgi:hypothetical protein
VPAVERIEGPVHHRDFSAVLREAVEVEDHDLTSRPLS